MSNWMNINAGDFAELTTGNINGVKVTLAPSPYEIPEKVRGYLIEEDNKFVIELAYIYSERSHYQDAGNGLSLEIGDNSKRIHKIFIDLNHMPVSKVNISCVLRNLAVGKAAAPKLNSSRVAVKIAEKFKDRLLPDVEFGRHYEEG